MLNYEFFKPTIHLINILLVKIQSLPSEKLGVFLKSYHLLKQNKSPAIRKS